MKLAELVAVAQGKRGILDGADATDKVFEYGVRAVSEHLIVAAAAGNVVGISGEEDEVAAVPHVDGVDDAAVEHLAGVRILQGGLAQRLEQAVFIAVGDLCGGKDDVDEIAAEGAGERLFQQVQEHLLLLLRHEPHGRVDVGDDLAGAADIAAVDLADGGAVGLEAAADFVEFFLVHWILLSRGLMHIRVIVARFCMGGKGGYGADD